MNNRKNGRNQCYTYFKITGIFNPADITKLLGLNASRSLSIGELAKNGRVYDSALWEYGRCDEYDVYVKNQMLKTIQELIPKIDILRKIKGLYDANFTLEIVPTVYAGDIAPCLAPSREVIEFCYKTHTEIDIDLYVLDSADS